MGGQGNFLRISNQKDITIGLMTIETTTNTVTDQNSVEKCENKMSKSFKPYAFH